MKIVKQTKEIWKSNISLLATMTGGVLIADFLASVHHITGLLPQFFRDLPSVPHTLLIAVPLLFVIVLLFSLFVPPKSKPSPHAIIQGPDIWPPAPSDPKTGQPLLPPS